MEPFVKSMSKVIMASEDLHNYIKLHNQSLEREMKNISDAYHRVESQLGGVDDPASIAEKIAGSESMKKDVELSGIKRTTMNRVEALASAVWDKLAIAENFDLPPADSNERAMLNDHARIAMVGLRGTVNDVIGKLQSLDSEGLQSEVEVLEVAVSVVKDTAKSLNQYTRKGKENTPELS